MSISGEIVPVPSLEGFSYLFCDLRTDETLIELPLHNVKFRSELKNPLDCDALLPLSATGQSVDDIRQFTAPKRTSLYVIYGDRMVWGGIVEGRLYRGSDHQVQFRASEFGSFYQQQMIYQTYRFDQVDQLDIARALIEDVSEQPGGHINLVIDTSLSGILRDRSYYWYEHKNTWEALFQLSEVIDGFDFHFDVDWGVNDWPRKILTFNYPRRGVIAEGSRHVFDFPGNLVDYNDDEDFSNFITHSHAIGEGEGDATLHAHVSNTVALENGYPLLQAVYSYKDIRRMPTLVAHAEKDLEYRSQIRGWTPVEISVNSVPKLGEWYIGDDCELEISDTWFPPTPGGDPGFHQDQRIMASQVDASTGQATLHLGMVVKR